MREWVIPSLGVFVAWGFWGFLPKLTVRYLPPRDAVIYEILGGVLLAVILMVIYGPRLQTDWRGVALSAVTGLVGFVGALLYLRAVVNGPVSLVTTISALYPVLVIAMAYFFLGETINLRQGIGDVMAMTAIYLIAT